MIKAAIILGLMILASCFRNESSGIEKMGESKNTLGSTPDNSGVMINMIKEEYQEDTLTLSDHIDKIEIVCLFFGKYNDNSFRIFLSNSKLNIIRADDENDTVYVDYNMNKSKIIRYVNQLYIDKTNKIVSSIKSEEEQIETDYPFIRVIGQEGETQIFKNDITLRNNIEFTPDFLRFYELLQELTNSNE